MTFFFFGSQQNSCCVWLSQMRKPSAQENRFKNKQKNLAVPQSAHNFLQMTEVGVQTEDTLQCSATESLLKNALPKGNFAKSPNRKLKPGEVPVL